MGRVCVKVEIPATLDGEGIDEEIDLAGGNATPGAVDTEVDESRISTIPHASPTALSSLSFLRAASPST